MKPEEKYNRIMSSGGGCSHCGLVVTMDNLCVFDFHHLSGYSDIKNADSGKTRSVRSLTGIELENEIKSCSVLCSNCHRILHATDEYKIKQRNAKAKGTRSGKDIGRPVVKFDYVAVKKMMADNKLKEAQAIRVLGYKPSTYYKAKKALPVGVE